MLAKKILAQSLVMSFLIPSVGAYAADLDAIWAKALDNAKVSSKTRTEGMTDINELYNAINTDRRKLMRAISQDPGLKKELLDQQKGRQLDVQEPGSQRRSSLVIGREAGRSRDGEKLKFIDHDGETLIACRDGNLTEQAVDPSEYRVRGFTNATGPIYMRICAAEQIEERDYCGQNLQRRYDQWESRDASRKYRTIGISNQVVFYSVMEEPKEFPGCSTAKGLQLLYDRAKANGFVGVQQKRDAIVPSGPAPRAASNLPGGRFSEGTEAAWFQAVHSACVNVVNNIRTTYTVSEVDEDFEELVAEKIGRNVKIVLSKAERDRQRAAMRRGEGDRDLTMDKLLAVGPMEGAAKDLRSLTRRELTNEIRRNPAYRSNNYGNGVCGGDNIRGGGHGRMREGSNPNGGFRDQNAPRGVWRAD